MSIDPAELAVVRERMISKYGLELTGAAQCLVAIVTCLRSTAGNVQLHGADSASLGLFATRATISWLEQRGYTRAQIVAAVTDAEQSNRTLTALAGLDAADRTSL